MTRKIKLGWESKPENIKANPKNVSEKEYMDTMKQLIAYGNSVFGSYNFQVKTT